MAIENVVVNFYSSTPATVSGKTINNFNSGLSAGLLDSDLAGYDTGAATGISFSLGSSRTPDASGRSAGADTLTQQINAQGAYHYGAIPSSLTDTFVVPETVTECDVIVQLCTTYSWQDDIDVSVNGSTPQTIDSSGNTTGAVLQFTAVTPGSGGEIEILIANAASEPYIFVNGYRLANVVEGEPPAGGMPGIGSRFIGSQLIN